ncbi:hypothetical protein MNBD_IGNAVI01-2141 [hydrothermal vent metagenome]|uniref:ATP synthase protein I2 n=1 Tax=hydrothermal vent metagenome TaxID=652676 RepID=A0A3B1CLX2_9ZZZZ
MKKIIRTIFFIYIPLIVIILILKLTSVVNQTTFISIVIALLLNLFNLSAALLFYYLSINRSNQVFMLFNLGGMGVRVFFLLIGFMIVLIFLEIDKYAFILVFLILYSLSIITEIKYFHKEDKKLRK